MVLTIDIGNTNINLGLFQGDMLQMGVRLATERQKTEDQFAASFFQLFQMHNVEPISSVVPEITSSVKHAIERLTAKKVLVLSPGVKTGLNILIDNPAQLGADLAAGAVGASAYYTLPAFVVDLGTATKIYAIDEKGVKVAFPEKTDDRAGH